MRYGIYRAGWPPSRGSWLDNGSKRYGKWWVRIGPYVIGDTYSWDDSGAS